MNFPKSSPELIERFITLVPHDPDVTDKKIFGYPACFVSGNMFTGLHGSSMILRLPEKERAEFISQTKSHIFEPMPGHQMKECVVIPDKMINNDLNVWLKLSMGYVRSLPPKIKKRKPKV